MNARTHDEVRDLLPIYALDALDGVEEMEVRTHLETCPDCQSFLDAYLLAAGSLALSVEPVSPPPALRDRLLGALPITPQQGVVVPLERRAAPSSHRLARSRSWGWERVTALVAVAALLVVGAIALSLVGRLHSQNRTEQAFIQSLGETGIRTLTLHNGPGAEQLTAQVLVSADGSRGGLLVAGLASPGKNVYKVWAIVGNQPVGLASFRPDSSGTALVPLTSSALGAMAGMAVTLETDPNVPAPQGPRVLTTA